MDMRKSLPSGAILSLQNHEGGRVTYTILDEIGRGGSCIVYNAQYQTGANDYKTIRIKECYPFGIRMIRMDDGSLVPDERDITEFQKQKNIFKQAFRRNNSIFSNDEAANYVSNNIDLYEANGTYYIVSSYLYGTTLTEHMPVTLQECISLSIATSKAISRIHKAGFLYLDLKPDNIFVIDGTTDIIQLFDFDALLDVSKLGDPGYTPEKISFTRGYAALELQKGQINRLAPNTDVFSLGAVLFWLLFGRVPDAFDCSCYADYEWKSIKYADDTFADRLFIELGIFFHRTLSSFQSDRYSTIEQAEEQLEIVAKYAASERFFLASSPLSKPYMCIGRDNELCSLASLTAEYPTISVSGMGGIGKSTVVRQYVTANRSQYDAVIWLYWTGDFINLLTNDQKVFINTVKKDRHESTDEYYTRKLERLHELATKEHMLFVIDDFDPAGYGSLSEFLTTGCQTILISREPLPTGLVPALPLCALSESDAEKLLVHWAGNRIDSARDKEHVDAIIRNTNAHTLLLELIGKQIDGGGLTIDEAASLTGERSLAVDTDTRVDYIRNNAFIRDNLLSILEKLISISGLTKEEWCILKLLSLFNHEGIEESEFSLYSGLTGWERLQQLGWLESSHDILSLHPITTEYLAGKDWGKDDCAAAEALMDRLYHDIHPEDDFPDSEKQFPENGSSLFHCLKLAAQIAERYTPESIAKNRLIYHLVMDSPIEDEEQSLKWASVLLAKKEDVNSQCILKVYSTAALLCQKMYRYEEAETYLEQMKHYLLVHPQSYYLAAWHNAKALCAWNASKKNSSIALTHWNKAIFIARHSHHKQSTLLLVECLLHKLTSLLDLHIQPTTCDKILCETTRLVENDIPVDSYEYYQYWCILSHYFAQMVGDREAAEQCMDIASQIAKDRQDSDLSWVDHLYDECFPLYTSFDDRDKALEILNEAVVVCEQHTGVVVYDQKRNEIRNLLKSLNEIWNSQS